MSKRRRKRRERDAGPLALAVDTSTLVMSAALVRPGRLVAEATFDLPRGHSRALLGAIDHLLERSGSTIESVDLLAVGRGPGSFTGLRIGMALAKGLALATQTPLVGVSSLAALARAWTGGSPEHVVVPCIDARKSEVYASAWRGAREVITERVVAAESLVGALDTSLPDEHLMLVGTGAVAYRQTFRDLLGDRAHVVTADVTHPPARHVGWLGLDASSAPSDLATLEPRYIRPSEAEVNLPKASR